jgi:IS5 family transposase
MLFVSYPYNFSERQTETLVIERIPAKYFIGMEMDKPASDHSTLTYFKKRMTQKDNLGVFEDMLAEIVQMAMEKGIQLAGCKS